jgi:hypothetical protein
MNLILGHNQFLGISHISEERSRERDKKFSDVKNIYNVVEKAADFGYKGLILETHPRMLEFLKYYKKNETFDMDFYLQLPYIQGYIQTMNEKGLQGLIFQILRRGGIKTTSTLILKYLINYTKKNYIPIGVSFLQFEIAPFRDINIKAIFLHNVITDLLLSLQTKEIFLEYISYVEENIGLKPGFITLNFQLFKNCCDKWDIQQPLVMTPINIGGYDMNPSKEIVETAINEYNGKIIAMNVLGGGAFALKDTYSYLKLFKTIDYCVIGASSEDHLRESMEVFSE